MRSGTIPDKEIDMYPDQLRLFMTAKEVWSLPASDQTSFADRSSMWRSKQRDNDQSGLSDHVAEEGVAVPVQLMHGYKTEIWDGHHRVQAAYNANPDSYVPVEHQTPEHYTVPRTEEIVTPGYDDYDDRLG